MRARLLPEASISAGRASAIKAAELSVKCGPAPWSGIGSPALSGASRVRSMSRQISAFTALGPRRQSERESVTRSHLQLGKRDLAEEPILVPIDPHLPALLDRQQNAFQSIPSEDDRTWHNNRPQRRGGDVQGSLNFDQRCVCLVGGSSRTVGVCIGSYIVGVKRETGVTRAPGGPVGSLIRDCVGGVIANARCVIGTKGIASSIIGGLAEIGGTTWDARRNPRHRSTTKDRQRLGSKESWSGSLALVRDDKREDSQSHSRGNRKGDLRRLVVKPTLCFSEFSKVDQGRLQDGN